MINHGLNVRPLNVEVVDTNYNIIYPESIQFIDSNNVKVIFPTSQTGWAALTVGEGSSGTSGLTYASSGSSGADGAVVPPAGAVGQIQYYATVSYTHLTLPTILLV